MAVNFAKWGSVAQWISAGAASLSAVAAGLVGYFVYDLNKSTYRVAEVTAQQAFLSRTLTLLNDYIYKIDDPAILRGGRCIAYINAIPDDLFRKYLRADGLPLFEINIIDIGEIAKRIDELSLKTEEKGTAKKELYTDLDICLDLKNEEALSIPNAPTVERAEIIKHDLTKRYTAFGLRYIPVLNYNEHVLITWHDAFIHRTNPDPKIQQEYEQESKLRAREREFMETSFVKSICFSRVSQLINKIERVNKELYDKIVLGRLFPRLATFVHEVCPTKGT
jgi:hypothetical protein